MANSNQFDVLDQCLLDRFVDGELSDEEERLVLAQLEQTPGGWRKCALTFVESRFWQREFHRLTFTAGLPSASKVQTRSGRWWQVPSWTGLLATSAVVLVAFAIGTFFPHASSRNIADSSRLPNGTSGNLAIEDVVPGGEYSHFVSKPVLPSDDRLNDPGHRYEREPVGNLVLVANNGEQIEVPVYDWDLQTANRFLQRAPQLSPDVLRTLEQHEIRRRQSYFPVQFNDGRRAVVPVQELEFVPVSNTAY